MAEQPLETEAATDTADKAKKNLAQLVYILQAVSLVIGLSAIIGIVVNYVKRGEVAGTWVASHFNWQIKTFWFALMGTVIGALLLDLGIGGLILLVVAVWYIYRIVRGWLALNDGKPLPDTLV